MEYWMIRTGNEGEPGIDGGMLRKQHPSQPCANTIGVADLDATLKQIETSGGTIAMPKMPVPGVGWLAYCKDTEGHMFGVLQPDPEAK
jgi:predicted enzyme related to lactoylglutathione lyase